MTPIIRVDHLRHTYSAGTPFEKVAIDDIDLDIPAGQFVGIIGHTGSGKSTFIQHLNGLLAPTSGTVFFDGEDIHRSKEATRDVRFQVGLVFQYPEHQLFEETVYRASVLWKPATGRCTIMIPAVSDRARIRSCSIPRSLPTASGNSCCPKCAIPPSSASSPNVRRCCTKRPKQMLKPAAATTRVSPTSKQDA